MKFDSLVADGVVKDDIDGLPRISGDGGSDGEELSVSGRELKVFTPKIGGGDGIDDFRGEIVG